MPSNIEKEAVYSRLKALLDAVYDEALRSPEFFDQIEHILLSPEAQLAVRKPASASNRQSINIVEVLHKNGEEVLRKDLERRTNDDLARLCVMEGVKRLKDAKILERESLIELILRTANSRLKQGESFTKTE